MIPLVCNQQHKTIIDTHTPTVTRNVVQQNNKSFSGTKTVAGLKRKKWLILKKLQNSS